MSLRSLRSYKLWLWRSRSLCPWLCWLKSCWLWLRRWRCWWWWRWWWWCRRCCRDDSSSCVSLSEPYSLPEVVRDDVVPAAASWPVSAGGGRRPAAATVDDDDGVPNTRDVQLLLRDNGN